MLSHGLKKTLKKIRAFSTSWMTDQTLDHLHAMRVYELGRVLELLPPSGRVLEIGAGTGWQAQVLERHGYQVSAIDLAQSPYRADRVWPVTEYDGRTIPFGNGMFDIVFTSNVLEHIPHVREFQGEIHRVLKPDGWVLHVLPSGSFRVWTNFACLLKHWTLPKAHGEHAGNSLAEIYGFSRRWWMRLFRGTGWTVVAQASNRLFYTGSSILDSRLSVRARGRLSRVLGGSCNIFVLRKKK